MADIIFAGAMTALVAGDLAGSPDVRGMLVMSGFSGGEDAVHLEDVTTIDEFDGAGCKRLDAAGVTSAYDDASDEWRWAWDAGYLNDDDDAGTVGPGSDGWVGILWYLHVDGTEANDVALAFEDTGPGNGVGTALLYTPHADGPLYLEAA